MCLKASVMECQGVVALLLLHFLLPSQCQHPSLAPHCIRAVDEWGQCQMGGMGENYDKWKKMEDIEEKIDCEKKEMENMIKDVNINMNNKRGWKEERRKVELEENGEKKRKEIKKMVQIGIEKDDKRKNINKGNRIKEKEMNNEINKEKMKRELIINEKIDKENKELKESKIENETMNKRNENSAPLPPPTTTDPKQAIPSTSIHCFSSATSSLQCYFRDVYYSPKYKEFAFVLDADSTIDGITDIGELYKRLTLSSIDQHTAFRMHITAVPRRAISAGTTSIPVISETTLVFSRFKPDNLLHIFHDDLLPIYWTMKRLCGGRDPRKCQPMTLLLMDDLDADKHFDLYHTLTPHIILTSDLDLTWLRLRSAWVGVEKGSIWYQYGFKQPQGAVASGLSGVHLREFAAFMREQLRVSIDDVTSGGYRSISDTINNSCDYEGCISDRNIIDDTKIYIDDRNFDITDRNFIIDGRKVDISDRNHTIDDITTNTSYINEKNNRKIDDIEPSIDTGNFDTINAVMGIPEKVVLLSRKNTRKILNEREIVKAIYKELWGEEEEEEEEEEGGEERKDVNKIKEKERIEYEKDAENCENEGKVKENDENLVKSRISEVKGYKEKDVTQDPKVRFNQTGQKMNKSDEKVKRVKVRGHKVKVMSLEEDGVREIIREVSRAGILIGAHGAGLVHALFLPPGALLVEIYPFGISPTAATIYRAISMLEGSYISYLPWENEDIGHSIAHPDYPRHVGGLSELPLQEQDRITSQLSSGVKLTSVTCCDDPDWLFRVYQDTKVRLKSHGGQDSFGRPLKSVPFEDALREGLRRRQTLVNEKIVKVTGFTGSGSNKMAVSSSDGPINVLSSPEKHEKDLINENGNCVGGGMAEEKGKAGNKESEANIAISEGRREACSPEERQGIDVSLGGRSKVISRSEEQEKVINKEGSKDMGVDRMNVETKLEGRQGRDASLEASKNGISSPEKLKEIVTEEERKIISDVSSGTPKIASNPEERQNMDLFPYNENSVASDPQERKVMEILRSYMENTDNGVNSDDITQKGNKYKSLPTNVVYDEMATVRPPRVRNLRCSLERLSTGVFMKVYWDAPWTNGVLECSNKTYEVIMEYKGNEGRVVKADFVNGQVFDKYFPSVVEAVSVWVTGFCGGAEGVDSHINCILA